MQDGIGKQPKPKHAGGRPPKYNPPRKELFSQRVTSEEKELLTKYLANIRGER